MNTKHILLVEDNPYDIFLTKRAFTKAKIVNPIQVVKDGEKAIAYLARGEPYRDQAEKRRIER